MEERRGVVSRSNGSQRENSWDPDSLPRLWAQKHVDGNYEYLVYFGKAPCFAIVLAIEVIMYNAAQVMCAQQEVLSNILSCHPKDTANPIWSIVIICCWGWGIGFLQDMQDDCTFIIA